MNTNKTYKKATEKVSEGNNHEATHRSVDADIIKGIMMKQRSKCDEGCISNCTHALICVHEFLNYVGNDSIVNKKLLGCACEPDLRSKYNSAINNQKFYRSYELYEDIHLQMQINKITQFNHYCDCKDRASNIAPNVIDKRLDQIRADFETYLGEKIYTPNLKTGVLCFEYLNKQGCRIDENKHGITIQFPQDREFILLAEMEAINVITNERNGIQTINFKEHIIMIRNRDNGELD